MMNTEKILIPFRRFPIYHKEKGWKKYKLNDITSVVNDKCSVANLCIETYISTENILPNYGGIKIASKLPTTGTFTRFKKGDVLFSNIRPYLKKVWWANFDGVASNDIIVFRALTGYDACFISHIIKSDAFITYSMIGAKGVKMPRGDKDMMLQYEVYVPNIEEQKEIAECLSSIDSYISSINEKVEQLKAHKKSLLQKLFPQKGKTIPEFRFSKFKGSKGWEEKKLGDIFKRITNKNTTNNQNVLTISAQHGLVSQYDYFHKSVAASNLSNYYLLKKGDFAYNKSRSQGYPYGTIKSLQLYDEGVVSALYICFRIKYCDIADSFFEHYFETELINEEIGKIAQEGARNHGLLNISTDDFFNKVVLLIPSQSEQKTIAECLSSIDRTIRLYSEKASQLKQHKKGIMQQLFPH